MLPQYTSKRKNRTTKNKQGGWLTELTKDGKRAEFGGKSHERDFFFGTWMRYGRSFFGPLLFSRISEKPSAGTEAEYFGHLLSLLAWWTRTKTSDPAPRHFACIVVATSQGHNNLSAANNVKFDLFQRVFSLCYPSILPVVLCFSSGTLKSKRCFPLTQRDGRGTVPGCQNW